MPSTTNTFPEPFWYEWDLSYTDDVYGPLYGGHSIQEAYYATIQKWLPSYIFDINRKLGSDVLQVPDEYRYRPDYRTLPRTAVCAVLVVVPGTTGTPDRQGDGRLRTTWEAQVSAFVFGTKDWQQTQALTHAYAAAIRACIVQHPSLDGFAETTTWHNERYAEGEHSSTRTTGLAIIDFETTLENTMNVFDGPPDPSVYPSPMGPEATDVDVTVTNTERA